MLSLTPLSEAQNLMLNGGIVIEYKVKKLLKMKWSWPNFMYNRDSGTERNHENLQLV
jgi:hypothetical protein